MPADFYGSIDREKLHARLVDLVNQEVADILVSLISSPVLLNGESIRSDRGIPLGRSSGVATQLVALFRICGVQLYNL